MITQSVTKQELSEYQPSQNPTYQIDSIKKEMNKSLFPKTDSIVDKTLSSPPIKLFIPPNLLLDGVETEFLLLDFPQRLRRKNADFPDLQFALLDTAGISPTLILNQNVKTKEKGSWAPFKI